jgi:flagellar motor switch protein FliN/FliY
MPAGSVLELDRKAEDPVDLYVNGLRFASGTLVLTEDGEWALRLADVAGHESPRSTENHREVEGAVS